MPIAGHKVYASSAQKKWSRGHTCADKIQLHALQELFEVLQCPDDPLSSSGNSAVDEPQLFLTLSVAAVSGQPSPKSMCFRGLIQGLSISILLGSSHTFLSTRVADQLSGISSISTPLVVKVANGHILQCTSCFFQASWSVDNAEFASDLKVISLSSYDMIVGFDWLEQFSPMEVYWKQRWMSIPYKGSSIMLYGESATVHTGSVVQICTVQALGSSSEQFAVPPEVQSILDEFASVFAEPSELPPSRACDHSIPLVQGAAPVNVRPYRVALALKDEIEQQIQKMLDWYNSKEC